MGLKEKQSIKTKKGNSYRITEGHADGSFWHQGNSDKVLCPQALAWSGKMSSPGKGVQSTGKQSLVGSE